MLSINTKKCNLFSMVNILLKAQCWFFKNLQYWPAFLFFKVFCDP